MKKTIIGLNDNAKELADLIRKKNESIDYINYIDSNNFRLDNKYLFSLAFVVVDYNNQKEINDANNLTNYLRSMYSICVITIACNTKSVKDKLYYNSSAITYIEQVKNLYSHIIIDVIDNINVIFDDSNYIKVCNDNIYYSAKKNHEFKVITSSSKDGFANLKDEIKKYKNYILYVEANELFELQDIEQTLDLLHSHYLTKVDVIFCQRSMPKEFEDINIKLLAF